jgi:hypothetical protein
MKTILIFAGLLMFVTIANSQEAEMEFAYYWRQGLQPRIPTVC